MRASLIAVCLLLSCSEVRDPDPRHTWSTILRAIEPIPLPAVISPRDGLVVEVEYAGPWCGSLADGLWMFDRCYSGPGIPVYYADAAWCLRVMDFDCDGDVDQSDFGLLQGR